MPLSPAAAREKLHNRDVTCRGYRREDGLWDIEGHLVDTKTYSFANRDRGQIGAGEPVHEMWIRLTIDEDMVIHHAEAATEFGPYAICPDIVDRFRRPVQVVQHLRYLSEVEVPFYEAKQVVEEGTQQDQGKQFPAKAD